MAPGRRTPEHAHPFWDDGLIARRARPADEDGAQDATAPRTAPPPRPQGTAAPSARAGASPVGAVLRPRLDALRELVGLSRARLNRRTLAEAGRVLEEAQARQRHSLDLTVVALAGATGSGKSTLFNALARTQLSEAGVRRPTTTAPVSCSWTERADGADGLLERLGIPPRSRRQPVRPYDPGLAGLVLIDLPDHDSAAAGHREQVDRMLGLVDAVIWVVDPEKYADAVLHERYLRPLAGYAEVTFVVLNQVDRLSRDAADQVLDDLRRLLDEDGLALGEHGEPGAEVLAVSALTGEGLGELRELLVRFTSRRDTAERRLAADVDGVAERLRPAYVGEGRPELTEIARQDFEDRLAEAVGVRAAGLAAERAWLREAERACGTSWTLARRWYARRRAARPQDSPAGSGTAPDAGAPAVRTASRPLVEQAVRTLAYEASAGLPDPWARAVRGAARRGAEGLAEALDAAGGAALAAARASRAAAGGHAGPGRRRGGGRHAASGRTGARSGNPGGSGGARPVWPRWWAVAAVAQSVLTVLQLVGAAWLLGVAGGVCGGQWWIPGLLLAAGGLGGPLLALCCRAVARGPARRYGLETERRLRGAAAGCGRARVLEPVAAELLRYREVRAQYVIAAGGV
ncbi:GTPase [Streptomyces gamaensis]|uniref:GTPase n=1 Tax=Streptomyces gamaensis TaxID=1763542 RepID=A0ABW0YXZ4_9ACTN